MKILGISAHYHDAAAALLVDGVPVAAVQEERLSRRKNDAAFPLAAISWCLERGGLEPEALDAVVFYEKPMLKFERILSMALRTFPRSWRSFPRAMKNALGEKLWVKGIIISQLGVPRGKVYFTEHHQAHAAAAFFTAPTGRAALLTADGVGEWATLSVGRGERGPGGAKVALQREIRFPHSLGMLYSTFTAYLGFEVNEGEFKVMGLAAYGTPSFASTVRKLLHRTADGAFELDLAYFEFQSSATRSFSARFLDAFGPARHPDDPLDIGSAEGKRFADIAASVQLVLEDVLANPGSSASSSRARRGMPAARSARRSGRIGLASSSRTGTFPTTRTGARRWTRTSWRASRPRTARRSSGSRTRGRSWRGSRTSSPRVGSSAGWMARRSSGRGRWGTAASSPRRFPPGCATSSTAASSSGKNSDPSRPRSRSRRRSATSTCRPAASG
jgi:hypothetical protein